jgi:hypothetical protein
LNKHSWYLEGDPSYGGFLYQWGWRITPGDKSAKPINIVNMSHTMITDTLKWKLEVLDISGEGFRIIIFWKQKIIFFFPVSVELFRDISVLMWWSFSSLTRLLLYRSIFALYFLFPTTNWITLVRLIRVSMLWKENVQIDMIIKH